MDSKRQRTLTSGDRFLFKGGKAAYTKLKKDCSINISKTLKQDELDYPISDFFEHSCLMFLLTLAFPYHSDMLYEFYTNLHVHSDYTGFTSRVYLTDIEFTKADLCNFLHISSNGPSPHHVSCDPRFNWTGVNQVIRRTNLHTHCQDVSGLVINARIIQHILRHTLLPKAGDRTKVTPLLSLTTYYIMMNTTFDVADLLIRYIENISFVREATSKRKLNLGLGHIVGYLVLMKYQLEAPNGTDIAPTFFTNHSFHILYGKKKGTTINEEDEERAAAEEGEPSWAPQQAAVLERLDQLEIKMDDNTTRLTRIEDKLDKTYDFLVHRFGRDPPPDEGGFNV